MNLDRLSRQQPEVYPVDVQGTRISYAAVGLRVELDEANCIVIRQTKLHGPDTEVTVTNVDQLMLGLEAVRTAQRYRDEERHRAPA